MILNDAVKENCRGRKRPKTVEYVGCCRYSEIAEDRRIWRTASNQRQVTDDTGGRYAVYVSGEFYRCELSSSTKIAVM